MNSLKGRLLLASAVVLVIFFVLTGLSLDRAFHERAERAEQEKLRAMIYGLLGASELGHNGRLSVSLLDLPDERMLQVNSGVYALILDEQKQLIWRSPSLLVLPEISNTSKVGDWNLVRIKGEEDDYLALTLDVIWSESEEALRFTFVALEDITAYQRQLGQFRQSLLGWLTASAVLLLIVQLLVLRWGLAPLSRLVSELRHIETGEKSQLDGEYHKELRPLTEGLNQLLRSERNHQWRYRNALGDLAHSLKTPLAVLRSLTEKNTRSDEDAQRLSQQIDHMNQIVEYQLNRAATAGKRALTERIRLREVIAKVVNALNKVYSDKQVNTSISVSQKFKFRADEGDLIELLGNLLDNACKWCNHKVLVSARLNNGQLSLCIEDDGPGFPDGQQTELLGRGVRADTHKEGQGIGLAVAADIVNAYEGEIKIDSSSLGGARVTVYLPVL